MESKKCTKCNETKLVSEFKTRKGAKDGYNSWCIECVRESTRVWRAANKQKVKETNDAWYQKNKERRAKTNAIWYKNNKEVSFAKYAKRRAVKLNAMTPTTCQKTIALIIKNRPEGYHVDHIVPLAKGGKHHQDNLCYLPAEFNLSKGAKLLSEHPEINKQFNELAIFPTV